MRRSSRRSPITMGGERGEKTCDVTSLYPWCGTSSPTNGTFRQERRNGPSDGSSGGGSNMDPPSSHFLWNSSCRFEGNPRYDVRGSRSRRREHKSAGGCVPWQITVFAALPVLMNENQRRHAGRDGASGITNIRTRGSSLSLKLSS